MWREMQASIKSLVLDYLAAKRPAIIDESELAAIRSHVTAALARAKLPSDRYLLDVVSETPVEISRSLGGLPLDLRHRVHLSDPDAAAASLLDLQREYEAARARGDRVRTADCRRAVVQAKDRLRLVLRRRNVSVEKRKEKEELLQWVLVWLENPELFGPWVELRRRASGPPAGQQAPGESGEE